MPDTITITYVWIGNRPMGKPQTPILLGRHNTKMTSNDLLLPPLISKHFSQLLLEKLLLAIDNP